MFLMMALFSSSTPASPNSEPAFQNPYAEAALCAIKPLIIFVNLSTKLCPPYASKSSFLSVRLNCDMEVKCL